MALRIPRGVESHTAVIKLADQVEVALTAIPLSAIRAEEPEPPENNSAVVVE